MSTSALPFEILRNGLPLLLAGALVPRTRGEPRTAIAGIPTKRFHPCPLCARNCDYKLLGEGGTRRSLPFWDAIRESVSLRQVIDTHWVLPEGAGIGGTFLKSNHP